MNIKENDIDELIQLERRTEPNPMLADKVMAILGENPSVVRQVRPIWKDMLAAASVIAAIGTGVLLGNIYNARPQQERILVINDQHIENLGLYQNITQE